MSYHYNDEFTLLDDYTLNLITLEWGDTEHLGFRHSRTSWVRSNFASVRQRMPFDAMLKWCREQRWGVKVTCEHLCTFERPEFAVKKRDGRYTRHYSRWEAVRLHFKQPPHAALFKLRWQGVDE